MELNIAGYQVQEKLYESNNSLIFRGVRNKDNLPVIFKILREEYPAPNDLRRYRKEYEIIKSLNISGVIRTYGLFKYHNTLVIILEDAGCKSLKQLLSERSFSLSEWLSLAIRISGILGELHAANIIHKDINPGNIIFNPETGKLKIIDFGIASELLRENPTLKNPEHLEGTLAYISPEQTGRMNRTLDYRTDIYSLGVTLYELLTHRLPFKSDDATELVHCHLARQPVLPHEFNSNIPVIISDIIIKLMAKIAEERYQSAWGVQADLKKCQRRIDINSTIRPFELGQQDISNKFQIPQKLYGRRSEINRLLSAFERISSENGEMMLVAGYSGIGKTALIQEIYKPVTEKRGYFISGKFEQFQRNIPYSAIVNAFKDMVRQLLSEKESQLLQWKSKLEKTLGSNGQVLVEIIPELELIIGKQPQITVLSPAESQNRFNLIFRNFFRALCHKDHHVVLFIDDLQWADFASLNLLKILMTDTDNQYFLIIGAYRDNEVSQAHPLSITEEEIKKAGGIVHRLQLQNLCFEDVDALIADTLRNKETQALTRSIYEKTNGNPFFTKELLKSLYNEGLLLFDIPARQWKWDIGRIAEKDMAANVVSLMVNQINKLPVRTRNILKSSAAIGNRFDLETLAIISRQNPDSALNDLWKAIEQGMVLPLDDNYKNSEYTSDSNAGVTQAKAWFKFRHDRIQQAAYSLIADAEKPPLHLQIGRLLSANISREAREERIFEIVNQWNEGRQLLLSDQQAEKNELARLNLLAGKKAKDSTAYQESFRYLQTGMELLPENSWENEYELTLSLYHSAAEAAYLSGDFEQAEEFVNIILEHSKNLLDKIRAYEVRIQANTAQNRLVEATGIGLQVLKLFGVEIPEKPTRHDVIKSIEKSKAELAGKHIEDLLYLPEVRDPVYITVGRILANVAAVFYFINPELYSLTAIAHVGISLKHGNDAYSAYAYASYGRTLCILGDIETGCQFGELALNVLERLGAKELKAKVIFMVNYFVKHWKSHAGETVQPLLEAYQSGVETGDLEYAGYSANTHVWHQYFIGKELKALNQDMAAYGAATYQIRQTHSYYRGRLHRQAVQNFMGLGTHSPCSLIGECYDETDISQIGTSAIATFHLMFNKFILCCYFQNYADALKCADIVGKYIDGVGAFNVPVFYFHDSLARLALYYESDSSEQMLILEKASSNQEKMKQWAFHSPMNNLHKWYLAEAERARISGKEGDARIFYDKAITFAHENEYMNEEALACELAGRYYLEIKMPRTARYYLQDAYHVYQNWGAEAKVKDIEEKYPHIISAGKVGGTIQDKSISIDKTIRRSFLDINSILKASQTLSGEIKLGSLLEKIMNIVIENAGAEKGFFIENENNVLIIQAEAAYGEVFNILKAMPLEESEKLPLSVIRYVARTQQHLVSDNISNDPAYSQDPYIQNHQAKSVICFPILSKGDLTGIIYLENNLAIGAFTDERLEILNLLSGQAAISFENAKLVSRLREEERLKREMELAHQIQTVLLPQNPRIDGYEIMASCEPADEVGGDYYDVISAAGYDWIIFGDVSGHGLTSGLVMMMVQTAIHTVLINNPTLKPSQLLSDINLVIYENIRKMNEAKHMTIVVLAGGRDGKFSFAGLHEDILVRRAATGKVENVETDGFWIGMEPDISDMLETDSLILEPGDYMVLFTDGLTEALCEYGMFGNERLAVIIENSNCKNAAELHSDILNALKLCDKPDDVTLFVMKRI